MSWRRVTLSEHFKALVGRTIVRRVENRKEVPPNAKWEGDEFQAVLLDDGTWLAVEHDPGCRGYSALTPGWPGHTDLWIWSDG